MYAEGSPSAPGPTRPPQVRVPPSAQGRTHGSAMDTLHIHQAPNPSLRDGLKQPLRPALLLPPPQTPHRTQPTRPTPRRQRPRPRPHPRPRPGMSLPPSPSASTTSHAIPHLRLRRRHPQRARAPAVLLAPAPAPGRALGPAGLAEPGARAGEVDDVAAEGAGAGEGCVEEGGVESATNLGDAGGRAGGRTGHRLMAQGTLGRLHRRQGRLLHPFDHTAEHCE